MLTLPTAIRRASVAVAAVLPHPALCDIQVEFGAGGRVTGLLLQYQSVHRSWWGGPRWRACRVVLRDAESWEPHLSPVTSLPADDPQVGVLRRPPLSVADVRLDLADVLRRLDREPADPGGRRSSLQLVLTTHEGRAVWWAVEETSSGVRTTLLAPDDGSVVYEKLDVAHEPGLGSLDLGDGWERVTDGLPLWRQLRLEIGPGHALAGAEVSPVARCRACDDVLVQVRRTGSEPGLAVVHLTWSDDAVHAGEACWPFFDSVSLGEFARRFVDGREHL